MLLLCYAFAGGVTFLSVSSTSIGVAPVLYKSPFHEITSDTRQVTLHHCSFNGSGTTPNHWDLFEYRLTGSARDTVRLPYWPRSHQELPAQYEKRLRMLQREADDETQRKLTKHRNQAQSAEAALERMLLREERSPISTGRQHGFSVHPSVLGVASLPARLTLCSRGCRLVPKVFPLESLLRLLLSPSV